MKYVWTEVTFMSAGSNDDSNIGCTAIRGLGFDSSLTDEFYVNVFLWGKVYTAGRTRQCLADILLTYWRMLGKNGDKWVRICISFGVPFLLSQEKGRCII